MSALEKSTRFETVNVGGEGIAAANVDGTVWVSVRRMCEALGLDVDSQRKRLADPSRSPWACTVMMTVQIGGQGRGIFCLDLDSVPMWLATIDASRVAEHVRPKVVLFQREAARVLRDHFFGPRSSSMPTSPVEHPPTPLPTRTEALRLALEASERADALEAQVRELAPKAKALDQLEDATNTFGIDQLAKMLGTGEIRMFRWLRENGILLPSNEPYQEHLEAGRFKLVERRFTKPNGELHLRTRSLVTGKGAAYIARRYVAQFAQTILALPSNDLAKERA